MPIDLAVGLQRQLADNGVDLKAQSRSKRP